MDELHSSDRDEAAPDVVVACNLDTDRSALEGLADAMLPGVHVAFFPAIDKGVTVLGDWSVVRGFAKEILSKGHRVFHGSSRAALTGASFQ